MRSRMLLPHRVGAAGLAALALLGPPGLDATLGGASAENPIARQDRYPACTARVDRNPSCNRIWSRHCGRECHALCS